MRFRTVVAILLALCFSGKASLLQRAHAATFTMDYPANGATIHRLSSMYGTVDISGVTIDHVQVSLSRASDGQYWNGAEWFTSTNGGTDALLDGYDNEEQHSWLYFGLPDSWTTDTYSVKVVAVDTLSAEHTGTFSFSYEPACIFNGQGADPSDWGDAKNWTPEGVPGPNDIAVNPGYEITSTISRTVKSFKQEEGGDLTFLAGPGPGGTLTTTGHSMWGTGSFKGTWDNSAGATLTIFGSNGRSLGLGSELINSGSVVWTGDAYFGSTTSGFPDPAAFITNKVGATFSVYGDAFLGGDGVFTNEGTFTKYSGTPGSQFGATKVTWDWKNSGTTQCLGGTLIMEGGGSGSGHYSGTAPGTLVFAKGDFSDKLFTINGANPPLADQLSGEVSIASGEVDIVGTVGYTGTGTAKLKLAGGRISGPGTLNVTGGFNWTSGKLGGANATASSVVNLLSGSASTIGGSAEKTFDDRARLTNAGTVTLSGTGQVVNYVYDHPEVVASFTNQAGGVVTAAEVVQWIGDGAFNNQGTFTTAIGVDMQWAFNNTGTATVTGGDLRLGNGGESTGVFNVTTPGTMQFAKGRFILTAPAKIEASGQVNIPLLGYNEISCYGAVAFNGTGAGRLNQAGGLITGSGTLNVKGGYNWTGGYLGDQNTAATSAVNLLAGSVNTISGDEVKICSDNGRLTNAGTLTWSGSGNIHNLGATPAVQGSITNKVGGNFIAASDAEMRGEGAFVNQGTFTKSTGESTSATVMRWSFDNSGTVACSAGNLFLEDGGASTGGTFTVNTPAELKFTGGTYSLGNLTKLVGSGRISIVTREVFIPEAELTYTTFGKVTTTGTVTSTNSGRFALEAGSLATLSGAFNVGGGFDWSGGMVGGAAGATGIVNLQAGSTSTISGAGNKTFGVAANLANLGTLTWSGAGGIVATDDHATTTSASFTNKAGGAFNITSDALLSGDGTFVNQGAFSKTGGATDSSTRIAWPFNNISGTVACSDGNLVFQKGGAETAGSLTATAPGVVKFAGGTYTLSNGIKLGGTGQTFVVTGEVNTSGTVAYTGSGDGRLNLTGGTLAGPGVLNIGGGFNWLGGTLGGDASGTAAVNLLANSVNTISGAATKTIGQRGKLTNAGALTWSDKGNVSCSSGGNPLNSASFTNLFAGVVSISSDADLLGDGVFANQGTVNKTAGAATLATEIQWLFNNAGAVGSSGGNLQFASGGSSPKGTLTATAPGALKFTGGTFALNKSTTLGGSGQITIVDGTVNTTGIVTYTGSEKGRFNLTGGALGAGALDVSGGFNWTGGVLGGDASPVVVNLLPASVNTIGGDAGKFFSPRSKLANAGTLTWTGAGNIFGANGGVAANGGRLTNLAAGTFVAAGSGSFSGDGFLENQGTLSLGASSTAPGIANVDWPFVQTASGILKIKINGPNAVTPQFDQLKLTNTASLGGTLAVTKPNSYVPVDGTSWKVLTFGTRTGSFASISPGYLSVYGSDSLTLGYDKTAPTLTIVTPANNTLVKALPAISGGAADNDGGSGIARVTVTLLRKSDSTFWSGTAWEPGETALTAVVTTKDGVTTWKRTAALPAGDDLDYGAYVASAVAYDGAGNKGATVTSKFTCDPVAPSQVAVTVPLAGASVFKLPSVEGTAIDADSGIATVTFTLKRDSDSRYWNGTQWVAGSKALETTLKQGNPVIWKRTTELPLGTSLAPGAYTITATATDKAGNTLVTTSAFAVAADTVVPTVTITTPANGKTVASLTSLAGKAVDGQSGVFKVQFTLQQDSSKVYWAGTKWTKNLVWLTATFTQGAGGSVNWSYGSDSQLLPAGDLLKDGVYVLTARSIDGGPNVSLPVTSTFTLTRPAAPVIAAEPRSPGQLSPIQLSTISAKADGTISFVFTGAVAAASALDATHYTVQRDGETVGIESAQQPSASVISLGVEEGALRGGDKLQVSYSLKDSAGRALQGVATVTVR